MPKKEDIYRYIKIGGLASFIPFILVSGPLAGYIAGTYLREKFGFGHIVVMVTTSIGLVTSIIETVKIIKKLMLLDTRK